MTATEKRLKTLENEVSNLRAIVERLLPVEQKTNPVRMRKDRMKLLDLFGSWDGEIDDFLHELSERRERRGRLE